MTPELRIQPTASFKELYASFRLVYSQYIKAGLTAPSQSELRYFLRDLVPLSTCFVALWRKDVVGTASAVVHSMIGLPSGSLFSSEITHLKNQGRVVMESTKFACDASRISLQKREGGRSIIAAELLKMLFAWSEEVGVDDWLILVHPRHVSYYHESLGFQIYSQEVTCKHVTNQPGVLLRLPIDGVLDKTYCLPDVGRQLFSSASVYRQIARGFFQLLEEEAAFLFAVDPTPFSEPTQSECQTLERYFPRFYERLSDFPKSKLFSPLCASQGDEFFELFCAVRPSSSFSFLRRSEKSKDSELQAALEPDALDFSLELQRILLPLSLRAERLGVSISVRLSGDISRVLLIDYRILRRILVSLVNTTVATSPPYAELELSIEATHVNNDFLFLHFQSIGQTSTLPYVCRKYTSLLGGATSLRRLKNGYTQLVVSVPALSLETSKDGLGSDQMALRQRYRDLIRQIQNSGRHILVNDRSSVDRRVIQKILEKHGYSIFVAPDHETTLELHSRESVDVILLEYRLPQLQGDALTQHLRSLDEAKGKRTPLVGLATSSLSQDLQLKEGHDLDTIVSKPLSTSSLLQAVRDPRASKREEKQRSNFSSMLR